MDVCYDSLTFEEWIVNMLKKSAKDSLSTIRISNIPLEISVLDLKEISFHPICQIFMRIQIVNLYTFLWQVFHFIYTYALDVNISSFTLDEFAQAFHEKVIYHISHPGLYIIESYFQSLTALIFPS